MKSKHNHRISAVKGEGSCDTCAEFNDSNCGNPNTLIGHTSGHNVCDAYVKPPVSVAMDPISSIAFGSPFSKVVASTGGLIGFAKVGKDGQK
jgi:hypothetical protein